LNLFLDEQIESHVCLSLECITRLIVYDPLASFSAPQASLSARFIPSLTIATVNFVATLKVELLLECGDRIDVNKTTNAGTFPLHIACDNEHVSVVKMLVVHHDIDVRCTRLSGSGLHFKRMHVSLAHLLCAQ
jgi:hypothetical protein